MEPHKPVLILMAGPNGSGKTTITTKVLCHEWLEDCVYINPDNIAKEMFGDWNSPEAVLKAAQYSFELREKFYWVRRLERTRIKCLKRHSIILIPHLGKSQSLMCFPLY